MFKASNYIILSFLSFLIFVSLMNIGVYLSNNNYLNDENDLYVQQYASASSKNFNTTALATQAELLQTKDSNLTSTKTTSDFSIEYLDAQKTGAKTEFSWSTVFNLPTFLVLALGFDLADWSFYINLLTYFATVISAIVLFLLYKGVI